MAKGRYIPRNPQKYWGNPNNIYFRSSWELTCCKFFDMSNAVSRWNSEEIHISYISPRDHRVHQYWPDFMVELINANKEIERWLIEVKPLKETSIEHAKTVYDKIAVAVNQAKWDAAIKFAAANNMKFKVITELDIYKMDPTKKKKTVKPKVVVKAKQPKKPVAPKKPKKYVK
jgi:hypothetical protein